MSYIADIFNKFENDPYLIDASTEQVLTYGQLAEASIRLADRLREAGLKKGSRIGLLLPGSVELACTYYACLFLGAVAVPVNNKYKETDREYIFAAARTDIILYTDKTEALLPETKYSLLKIDLSASEEGEGLSLFNSTPSSRELSVPEIDHDALFSLTFTSGTTGRPKGIFHTANTLFTNAAAFKDALAITPAHRFYHIMPMSYMAGFLNCLLCPFVAGASVVVNREFDAMMAMNFWAAPIKHNVNCMWLSPSVLSILLKMDRGEEGRNYTAGSMRFIASCTAPLPVDVKKEFEEKYETPVLPSFGLSETLINTIDRPEERAPDGTVGKALTGVVFTLINETGDTSPAGQEGEILIESQGQMIGYLNPETGTPDILPRNHAFPTGDLGIIEEGGHLRITDRKKDLIIRGGVNISPKKIEDCLCMHEHIVEAAVVGIPDPAQGEKVAAALVLSGDTELKDIRKEIENLCQSNLESTACPEIFRQAKDFPRSSTGKVKKTDLRNILSAG
ncbi:class I adenylate-forming enzyme family protein [Desulfovibrio sp. JC022]|uniref:class I adenylate-forming enzyme family protein n=1 Tax=Desulfovibrio sp. JC022 TaxID=2593642 RepID=UPI0013D4BF4E|nr:class I adenylate-forming enzyme family protein [Desulfovibrio sp. JC022]NDV22206.1 acyl--CoA ligase [Desulfovibrio sp. JC022]